MRSALIYLLFFALGLVWSTPLNAQIEVPGGIPVFDFLVKQNMDALKDLDEGKWSDYLQQFKPYMNACQRFMTSMQLSASTCAEGYIDYVLRELNYYKFFAQYYFNDMEGIETWRDIFMRHYRIVDKFPALTDFSYLYNNRFYQRANTDYGLFTENNIKAEKEWLADLENMAVALASIRGWENEQNIMLQGFQAALAKFGTGNGQIANSSKLLTLTNAMQLEQVKTTMQIIILQRLEHELELKRNVKNLDAAKREANVQMQSIIGGK